MSNDFKGFVAGFDEDNDPTEGIMKILREIDKYKNGASYEQLLIIMPNLDILKFHLESQKDCGFITESRKGGERIFETTSLGKDILDESDLYSSLDLLEAVPDVSKVVINQSTEEKILFRVYGEPKKKRIEGSLYGYINPLQDGSIYVEVVDAQTSDDEQIEGLDVVGFYRSEWPAGCLIRKTDVDDLLQLYDEHDIIMCIDPEETGERTYQFWGINTEKEKGKHFKVPYDVRIGE